MTGLPSAAAEPLLEFLVDVHLLESPAPSRYRLHDLLRVFAAEKAQASVPQSDRAQALSRVVAWYAAAATGADLASAPHRRRFMLDLPDTSYPNGDGPQFASRAEALAWSDQEHRNLLAATIHARDLGLPARTWQLAITAWGPLTACRRWESAEATHRIALAAARAMGNRAASAWLLNGLGGILLASGRLDEADEALGIALAMRRELRDAAGQAVVLNNLGVLARLREDTPLAARRLEESRVLLRLLGDDAGEAKALRNLAELPRMADDPELVATCLSG
ncbi:tetratricopeptide repeat protein [Catenulispora yoronensis]